MWTTFLLSVEWERISVSSYCCIHVVRGGKDSKAKSSREQFSKQFLSLQISSDSHDEAISSPIAFEISSNASKFAAFSAIRSLVLEHETKYNTIYKLENKLKSLEHQMRSRSEDDGNECKSIDVLPKLDTKINVPHVSDVDESS